MKIISKSQARTTVLTRFAHLELATAGDVGAKRIDLGNDKYYYARAMLPEGDVVGHGPSTNNTEMCYFAIPIVLNSDDIPWAEAGLYIMDRVQQAVDRKDRISMRQFTNIAEDLAAFLRFIEEYSIDWLSFPKMKPKRPTYRFQSHTNALIECDEIAHSVGRRRTMTVKSFYAWLTSKCLFKPENPMWVEGEHSIPVPTSKGFSIAKVVKSVDTTKVIGKESPAPHSVHIIDGGKLRPLPEEKQRWLIEALEAYGNTEVTLVHYFGLFVGARIQTILTLRKKHFFDEPTKFDKLGDVIMKVGPGTGADTKNKQTQILYIPLWLYQQFRIYVHSKRATSRRLKAIGGDIGEQYLFLTTHGNPCYDSMYANQILTNIGGETCYPRVGGSIRKLVKENIIPFVQKKYDAHFRYQMHDLRATFGMNCVDARCEKFGYTETLRFVQGRLCHASPLTTELYLGYRERINQAKKVQDSWELEIQQLAHSSMEGKIV